MKSEEVKRSRGKKEEWNLRLVLKAREREREREAY